MTKRSEKKAVKRSTAPKSAQPSSMKEAEATPAVTQPAPAALDPRLPPPGTVLQKIDRQGAIRCECTIGEDGIHYAGQTYRSLSGAAMAAAKDLGLANKTQNGYAFWGITKPARKSGDPLGSLNRAWERYRAQAEGLTKATEKPEGLLPALGQHSKAIEALLGSVA
jgi:hypothetical protein